MKLTAHPTNPRYNHTTVQSVCRQCGWEGPARTNIETARRDGREHTAEEKRLLSVVSGLTGRNTQ